MELGPNTPRMGPLNGGARCPKLCDDQDKLRTQVQSQAFRASNFRDNFNVVLKIYRNLCRIHSIHPWGTCNAPCFLGEGTMSPSWAQNGWRKCLAFQAWSKVPFLGASLNNEWGEPTLSYGWTGWVWENNGLKLKTPSKSPIVLEESIECTSN